MSDPRKLTDRAALLRNRRRARDEALFLYEIAADEIEQRLKDVNRPFSDIAVVSGQPDWWRRRFPQALHVEDAEVLALEPGRHDLVIHAMALHWADDPVGQIIQCRRALRPDGLFLAALFGGETLGELRAALAEAESRVMGGLSPRVAPMGEIRAVGALLQRAGLALPVADAVTQKVRYRTLSALMSDLRGMGEGNALAGRLRHPTPRGLFAAAENIYRAAFPDGEGLAATFELLFLAGWAPDASQPQPLRPGSATHRLAQALGVPETPVPDDPEGGQD